MPGLVANLFYMPALSATVGAKAVQINLFGPKLTPCSNRDVACVVTYRDESKSFHVAMQHKN